MKKIILILIIPLILSACAKKPVGLKIPVNEQLQLTVIGYDHEGNAILVTK